MADSFDKRFPNIARWMDRGYIEFGYDDSLYDSFIRVLDIGGMIWEGEARYETVDDALAEADAAIAEWHEENM